MSCARYVTEKKRFRFIYPNCLECYVNENSKYMAIFCNTDVLNFRRAFSLPMHIYSACWLVRIF